MAKKRKKNGFESYIHMKYVHHTIRILTGAMFLVIFASKFGFFPSAVNSPQAFTPEGFAFIQAIQASGYLFPFVGLVCLIAGLAFLANRYVALAAVILMPVTVSFAVFHIFLGFPEFSMREAISYIPLLLNVYMIYTEREKYRPLLKP